MQLFESAEVRWFFPDGDARVPALVAWFSSVKAEEPRVDRYLRRARSDLGLKLRGAKPSSADLKLEAKFLVASPGAIELGRVRGRVERWRKVAFTVASSSLEDDGAWLAIEKERRARRWALAGGAAREVSGGALESGCNAELTALCAIDGDRRRRAWTLGLEAFGREDALLQTLEESARALFSEQPSLTIGSDRAASYPSWIAAANA